MNLQISEFYRQLDLEPGADLALIRKSYHQLVKVWHPDRFGHDEKLQLVANDKLKKINLAYESLVVFIETGGKNEPSSTPKPEEPPRNTKVSSSEEVYRAGLDRYKGKDYKEALRFFCQRSVQNQPHEVESKPANLRRGYSYHISLFGQALWLRVKTSRTGMRALSSPVLRSKVRLTWVCSSPLLCFGPLRGL